MRTRQQYDSICIRSSTCDLVGLFVSFTARVPSHPSHVGLLQVDRGQHLGDAIQVLRHRVEGLAELLREARLEPLGVLARYAVPGGQKPTDRQTDRQTRQADRQTDTQT